MSLYLIRHGETAWSISGQHTGRTDIPLTAQGEQDARTLAEGLRAVRFSRVFTSPRQRARRTCELVGLDAATEIEPGLVEWDYGDYEGQRSVDIRKRRPDWNLFRDGCPHGESPADVSDRADRLITRLRALQGNIAVFSHGHFGRVLAARWIGLSVSQAQHFLLSTASLSILGYEQNSTKESAIVLWNAVSNNTVASEPDQRARDNDRTAAGPTAAHVSPLAGKSAPPSMLVNVPRLVTAYYAEHPDPSVAAERVAFGTSGHRGSAFERTFNEAHILAITQAICSYRQAHRIDGPLFMGMDTHALSEPAFASALEVLAANGVEVMIDQGSRLHAHTRHFARHPSI